VPANALTIEAILGEIPDAFRDLESYGHRVSGWDSAGCGNFSVGFGLVLRFPAAGWYTWRGTVVEGRGVVPEIDVPLAIKGLRRGRDSQLDAAVATLEAM
jgi:C-terminal processing protease CtpA/Prc